MKQKKTNGGRLDIAVGEVVHWGETGRLGIVKKIRVINSAALVDEFSGDPEEIILSVEDLSGMASVWSRMIPFQKAEHHEAKEFKSRFKKVVEP